MDGVTFVPNLHIAVAPEAGRATRLVVRGELDAASAPRLRTHIRSALAAGITRVVVDLAAVSFIDAAGLGVLVGARRRLADAGGELEVVHASRPVRRVLEITGLGTSCAGALRDTPAELLHQRRSQSPASRWRDVLDAELSGDGGIVAQQGPSDGAAGPR